MSFCKKKFNSYTISRTCDRPSFANQPNKLSNSRKSSKASKPSKNWKSLFFKKPCSKKYKVNQQNHACRQNQSQQVKKLIPKRASKAK